MFGGKVFEVVEVEEVVFVADAEEEGDWLVEVVGEEFGDDGVKWRDAGTGGDK